MDFRQFGSTPVSKPEKGDTGASAPVAPQSGGKKPGLKGGMPKWVSVLYVVILFGVATLLVLIAVSIARSSGSSKEFGMVDDSKYQAVFLNNGQVYFGNVTDISGDYLKLNNVFYLTQNSATTTDTTAAANSDYTLIKLGCQQIHYPFDQMVINRSQVTFWENLSDDGKVAQSIVQFNKENPDGPDCTQTTDQTQSSNNTGTQGSTNSAAGTQETTNTTN